VAWPSTGAAGPYAGSVWAVEVELTPKPAARTARIMAGLLARPRYAQVVYLTSPAARPVVTATAAALPDGQQGRVAVRDLPPGALITGQVGTGFRGVVPGTGAGRSACRLCGRCPGAARPVLGVRAASARAHRGQDSPTDGRGVEPVSQLR
jgi:hypothetical protein